MRVSIVPLFCALLTASTFAASPASEPTTLPTIPSVTSLEDLRALPPMQINGWEARVGIADGGRDAGPWKVLYCLAKPASDDRAPNALPSAKGSLGPLTVEFERVSQGCPVLRLEKQVDQFAHRVASAHRKEGMLFARIVPLTSKGMWELSLSLPSTEPRESPKPLLRSLFKVAEDPPLYWQQFAAIERFQDERDETRFRYVTVAKPVAALPQIDGFYNLLPTDLPTPERADNNPKKENHLPGGIPLLGGWAEAITGVKDPAAVDVPPLTLSIAEGWFVVQSRGPQMLDWPDHRLLARWWINGEPVPAPRATRQIGQQEGRQVSLTKETRVQVGLPATLGQLKPGDRVAVQLLYTPDDLKPVFDGQEVEQARIQHHQGETACPLPSNRIEFVITEQMLRDTNPGKGP